MGGWNDPTETVIAGTGQAYIAATGTALPTTEDTTLNTAFSGLGYHTEEGVAIKNAPEIKEFGAWQSAYAIKTKRVKEQFEISLAMLQFTEINIPAAFGGGTVSEVSTGHYKFTPPDENDSVFERALVVDVDDGSTRLRFVIPRATVVEGVETSFSRDEMAILPITFRALEPDDGTPAWHLLTDASGLATGS
jgi:hypothetical protein